MPRSETAARPPALPPPGRTSTVQRSSRPKPRRLSGARRPRRARRQRCRRGVGLTGVRSQPTGRRHCQPRRASLDAATRRPPQRRTGSASASGGGASRAAGCLPHQRPRPLVVPNLLQQLRRLGRHRPCRCLAARKPGRRSGPRSPPPRFRRRCCRRWSCWPRGLRGPCRPPSWWDGGAGGWPQRRAPCWTRRARRRSWTGRAWALGGCRGAPRSDGCAWARVRPGEPPLRLPAPRARRGPQSQERMVPPGLRRRTRSSPVLAWPLLAAGIQRLCFAPGAAAERGLRSPRVCRALS